jgi:hypothetical protein
LNFSTDANATEHKREHQKTEAITHGLRFVRSRWVLAVALSALILAPCFWHRRIEAGDLGSHTYNAWLALLVARGQAPGLYVTPQSNNVAVDLALTWLGSRIGFIAAERTVVSVCVLCFFWGAFAFIAACTRRAPWFLVPALVMVTYGYTFYAGLLNFYLSLGLAFAAVALFWRGTRLDWIVGITLTILAFVAHPAGFAAIVALTLYIRLSEAAQGWQRWLLLGLSLLAVSGLFVFFFRFKTAPGLGIRGLLMTGADQLLLFGGYYRWLYVALSAFGSLCFLLAAVRDWRHGEFLNKVWTPITLWTLLLASATMLPRAIWLPQYAGPVSSISSRLTSVTAIVALCVLGSLRFRRWIFAGLLACAISFFSLQYKDTSALNRMEQQAESLVSELPYGWRVAYTMYLRDDDRINFRHFVDRACIRKCFAYSNYEPGSGQFRVRISPSGSPLVSDSGLAMELGEYRVRDSDTPMAQIYQPDENNLTRLAIRELKAGEKNGRIGHHPPLGEIATRLSSGAN